MKVYLIASGKKAPLAPSSLTATAVSSSRIDLAWTDNSTDEDGFKIERSLDGVNFTEITSVGAGVTTYASTGLSASTQYYYRVRAYKGTLNSAYSNTANATTLVALVERIIEINTANTESGSTANDQFRLVVGAGSNFDVDWGDGTTQTGLTTSTTKTYATSGIYDIKLTGVVNHAVGGLASSDKRKYLRIKQWGSGVTSTTYQNAFFLCINLTVTATDAPNLSGVTNLTGMFESCSALNSFDASGWDVSGVTSFANMFRATPFNGNVTNWNTSSATTMFQMFDNNSAFNQNIGSWNVSNVTNLSFMFTKCRTFNQDISGWNTASCTNFASMFAAAGTSISLRTNFNQPIGSWNTSSATNMNSMFYNCAINQPLNSWDVSNVTNMAFMFTSSPFNQNIGSWNVSAVSDFSSMFRQNTAFNNGGSSDINNWTIKTTGTVNMTSMFQNCISFNQPVDSWNTSAVTNMTSMFQNATIFNQPLNSWNVSNVITFSNMFNSASAFNQDLSSWNVSKCVGFDSMFQATAMGARSISSWGTYVGTGLTLSNTFTCNTMYGTFPKYTGTPTTSWNMIRCNSIGAMYRAGGPDANYGVWDIRNVSSGTNFMGNALVTDMTATNLADTYIAWASLPVQPLTISFGAIKYDASGASARAILTAPRAVSVTGAIDPNANGSYPWNGIRYQNANGFFFINISPQWSLRNSANFVQATSTGTFPTQNTVQPATATGWTGIESGIVVTMTGGGWTITDGGQL